MSDRDLMQQALDAMMTIRPYEVVDYDQLEASITALRQALETEQEPVAWLKTWSDGSLTVLKTKSHAFADHELEPLYAAPPKREWVSLTDEEIDALSQARSLTDELMDCVEACTTWCGLCGRNPWHRNQP